MTDAETGPAVSVPVPDIAEWPKYGPNATQIGDAAMSDNLDYLTSPHGMPLVDAGASAVFVAIMLESIIRSRISFGSLSPTIRKSDNPRNFWSIILLYGVIAVWMGVKAAQALL